MHQKLNDSFVRIKNIFNSFLDTNKSELKINHYESDNI